MTTALYRKYRPKFFSDVVGQDAVVAALKNQVRAGRIGHAYIFTGIRGTGKTSFAKILAKATNCPEMKDGEPCGSCDICEGIDNGSILDVTEIDAASNNGVDYIRSLREETAYYPAMCKMRIYIIDEVHMLTREAFNALLKIMEEPPAHVLFILATTEVHRVPATILSRCQRFDLRRITAEDIEKRITEIAQTEGISLTQDAAALIAQLADGALRDALSLLDTCSSMGSVDKTRVEQLAGVVDKRYLFELSDAIEQKNFQRLFSCLAVLHENSVDPTRLCLDLLYHYRNLLLMRVTDGEYTLGVSEEERTRYQERTGAMAGIDIVHIMDVLGEAADKMTAVTDRVLMLELCLVKLCSGEEADGEKGREKSEKRVQPSIKAGKLQDVARQETETVRRADAECDASGKEGGKAFPYWREVVESLSGKNGMLYGFLENSTAFIEEGKLCIDAGDFFTEHIQKNDQFKREIQEALLNVTGKTLLVNFHKKETTGKRNEPKNEENMNALLASARAAGVEVEEYSS